MGLKIVSKFQQLYFYLVLTLCSLTDFIKFEFLSHNICSFSHKFYSISCEDLFRMNNPIWMPPPLKKYCSELPVLHGGKGNESDLKFLCVVFVHVVFVLCVLIIVRSLIYEKKMNLMVKHILNWCNQVKNTEYLSAFSACSSSLSLSLFM